MLFSTAKTGHIGQILSTGFLGEIFVQHLTPPSPDVVQAWGSMVIQLLVAIVTVWATIRKALQKPETVVRVPVEPPATLTVTSATVAAPPEAGGVGSVLLLALGAGLLGGGCVAHQPTPPPSPALLGLTSLARPGALPAAPALALDSVVVVPHRGRVGRVLGGRPAPKVLAAAVGRVGKKATVSVYYGPATVSSAAKKAAAGPAAVGWSAGPVAAGPGAVSEDYTKQGQRDGLAVSGREAVASKTTEQGLSWWWLLVPGLGGLGWMAWRKRAFFGA